MYKKLLMETIRQENWDGDGWLDFYGLFYTFCIWFFLTGTCIIFIIKKIKMFTISSLRYLDIILKVGFMYSEDNFFETLLSF